MKTFSIHRFKNVLWWDLRQQRLFLLRMTLVWTAIFLFIYLPNLLYKLNLINEPGTEISVFWGIYIIYITLVAGRFLGGYGQRPQRLGFLVLPATNFEKFLSRLVYVTIVATLIFAAGFLIADLIQFLITLIGKSRQAEFMFPHLFDMNLGFFTIKYQETIALPLFWLSSLTWGQSLFLLGGMLFRKHQVFQTIIFLTLLSVAIFMLTTYLANIFLEEYMFVYDPSRANTTLLLWSAGFAALAVLNYWLSYRLFCRLQLIHNKWLNI